VKRHALTSGLWTVEQAAENAGVDVATVRYWQRRGYLTETVRDIRAGRVRVLFAPGAVMSLVRGTCRLCGVEFDKAAVSQVYCSPACRKNAHRLRRAG